MVLAEHLHPVVVLPNVVLFYHLSYVCWIRRLLSCFQLQCFNGSCIFQNEFDVEFHKDDNCH